MPRAAKTEGAMRDPLITQNPQHDCFILQINGRARSQHRRFIDALRAGLQLKDQFPQCDIKVRTLAEAASAGAARRIALH
jgi:hypothetical protein